MERGKFQPRRFSRRGWLLVGFMVLLSSIFIAIGSMSLALSQSRQVISLRQNDTEAFYLAQAGVMQALYDIRRMTATAGGIELREYVVNDGPAPGTSDADVFILGGQAGDFLLADMQSAIFTSQNNLCGRRRDRMEDWPVTNVLAGSTPPTGLPLTVTQVKVNWSPAGGEQVLRVVLNGSNVWSDCNGASINQWIDIADQTIAARQTWAGGQNRIWFSSRNVMSTKSWIDISVQMSDGTVQTARYDQTNAANRTADITLKAVGEVRNGAFPFIDWRRIQATYRLGSPLTNPGALRSYQELTTKSP